MSPANQSAIGREGNSPTDPGRAVPHEGITLAVGADSEQFVIKQFFNGKSVVAWVLTGAGALIILAGIIANLRIYFGPASLFDTLVMLVMLAGGIGLIARSLKRTNKPI